MRWPSDGQRSEARSLGGKATKGSGTNFGPFRQTPLLPYPGVAQGEGLPRTPTHSSPTQQLSFELFRAGKTIAEIAAERKFALTTIEGHLVPFVARGELDVLELISAAKLEEISQHVHSQPDRSLSEWKVHFGDKFSYGELKLTMAYLQRQQGQSHDLERDSSRLD